MSAIKNISLFVPHVFPNFTQKYVAESFADLGDVDRVDFVTKQDRDGKDFNAAYIHFKRWYDNRAAITIQDTIANDGSTKFYHDDSEYYWIVLPNTAKKHIPGERKPRIDLGEAKSVSVKSVQKTPEKQVKEVACPGAPKKPSYAHNANSGARKPIAPTLPRLESSEQCCLKLFDEFDAEVSEDAAQMAEIEAELEAEDKYLVSIDSRYVQTIEQENLWLHGEIAQLRMALINLDQMYQAEKAKVRAFNTSVDL
jgi:hypothetical protein